MLNREEETLKPIKTSKPTCS